MSLMFVVLALLAVLCLVLARRLGAAGRQLVTTTHAAQAARDSERALSETVAGHLKRIVDLESDLWEAKKKLYDNTGLFGFPYESEAAALELLPPRCTNCGQRSKLVPLVLPEGFNDYLSLDHPHGHIRDFAYLKNRFSSDLDGFFVFACPAREKAVHVNDYFEDWLDDDTLYSRFGCPKGSGLESCFKREACLCDATPPESPSPDASKSA